MREWLVPLLVVAVVVAWVMAGLATAAAFHFWRTRELLRGRHVRLLTKLAGEQSGPVVALVLWGALALLWSLASGRPA